jgi:hypothetical protein
MVERFNGRIGSEVLAITIYSHRNLEQLLRGFNATNNARRQRVLEGKTPNQIVVERLQARPQLNKPKGTSHERPGPCDITKARFIVEGANDVSQPDTRVPSGIALLRQLQADAEGGGPGGMRAERVLGRPSRAPRQGNIQEPLRDPFPMRRASDIRHHARVSGMRITQGVRPCQACVRSAMQSTLDTDTSRVLLNRGSTDIG